MDKCLVYGCPNSIADTNSSIQLYHFPKHPVIAQQWLNSCCVWNSEEIDLNLAKICAIHFDEASYTSAYEMVDYARYERILKDDAIPTLDLPQQTIVYRVAHIEEVNFPDQHYEASGVIMQNTSNLLTEQVEDCCVKYEELQSVPIQNGSRIVEMKGNEGVDEKYLNIDAYQLEAIKVKNDKLKKELVKLERNVANLKKRLCQRRDESQKQYVEYNKLLKILSQLELKSLSIGEQKSLLSKVFSESQIKILSGKKKIYWSHDDMAIGYTIRHMSNKRCYIYLSKKLNIPLPGLSSIKRWQALKKNESVTEEKAREGYKKEYSDEIN